MDQTMETEPVRATPETLRALTRGMPGIARRACRFALLTRRGRLDVRFPNGQWIRFAGGEPGPEAVLIVTSWAFARRVVTSGDIGVGEAFIAGDWESPDVTAFLEFFCVNTEALHELFAGRPYMRVLQWLRHALARNTRSQAQRNIHAHYDLGNDFYAAWLDRGMTYSSALFAAGDNDLAAAQDRKYRALAQSIGLAPEHHLLEIGCGWGGFAEFAAREIGCRVTGITISRAQHAYASARIQAAGLGERVSLHYRDYRDETGLYDRVASIEMFEAVGEAYWPTFFDKLKSVLTPGGVAGLQIITIQERFFERYRREIDFIRRYIFPGGMLPTQPILQNLAGRAGLTLAADRAFGRDYAQTLVQWRSRFEAAWPSLAPLGFDDRFRRLWTYYLHYCEAGFRAGHTDVRQLVFARP